MKSLEAEEAEPHQTGPVTLHAYSSRFDNGMVGVLVEDPLTTEEYDAVRRRLARQETVITHPYESYSLTNEAGKTEYQQGPGSEEDRYPPLPANAGFNLFGPSPDMIIANARGDLLFGGRAVSLVAPSLLQLNNVSDLRQPNAEEAIPLPVSVANHTANLQFTAVGQVAVNGEDQTSFLRRDKPTLEGLSVLAAVAAALFAMLQVLQSIRQPKTEPPRTQPSDRSD